MKRRLSARRWVPWIVAAFLSLLAIGYSIPGTLPKSRAVLRLGERREDLRKYLAARLIDDSLVVTYRASVASSTDWIERDVVHSMQAGLHSIKWFALDDRRAPSDAQWPQFVNRELTITTGTEIPIQKFAGVGADSNGAGASLRSAAMSNRVTVFPWVKNDLVVVVGPGVVDESAKWALLKSPGRTFAPWWASPLRALGVAPAFLFDTVVMGPGFVALMLLGPIGLLAWIAALVALSVWLIVWSRREPVDEPPSVRASRWSRRVAVGVGVLVVPYVARIASQMFTVATAGMWEGRVVDDAHRAIPGAVVAVVWTTRGIVQMDGGGDFNRAAEAITDSDGRFSLPGGPALNLDPFISYSPPPETVAFKEEYRPGTGTDMKTGMGMSGTEWKSFGRGAQWRFKSEIVLERAPSEEATYASRATDALPIRICRADSDLWCVPGARIPELTRALAAAAKTADEARRARMPQPIAPPFRSGIPRYLGPGSQDGTVLLQLADGRKIEARQGTVIPGVAMLDLTPSQVCFARRLSDEERAAHAAAGALVVDVEQACVPRAPAIVPAAPVTIPGSPPNTGNPSILVLGGPPVAPR
jgi:hypothetical protein